VQFYTITKIALAVNNFYSYLVLKRCGYINRELVLFIKGKLLCYLACLPLGYNSLFKQDKIILVLADVKVKKYITGLMFSFVHKLNNAGISASRSVIFT